MDVMYQKEYLTRPVIEEMGTLIQAHNTEVRDHGEPDVDWLAYQTLQDTGVFHFYTIRSRGDLMGYIGYVVAPNLHHRGQTCAVCDIIYVDPAHRGRMYAVKLMKYAEQELTCLGVSTIGQSVKSHHDFGPMLTRQGYVLDEHYYTKEVH